MVGQAGRTIRDTFLGSAKWECDARKFLCLAFREPARVDRFASAEGCTAKRRGNAALLLLSKVGDDLFSIVA